MPSNGVALVDIQFGILGRTALFLDGDLHENWGRPREHAILATLLVQPGRTVSYETLVEWAWPWRSTLPQDPASTLYTHAARLRKSLDRLPAPPLLSAGNGGYRLEVDKSLIDYHLFRVLIARAREHVRERDPMKAAAHAEQAIDLWRGVPAEDIHSEPAESWRERVLRDEWLPAQLTLLEAWLATRQFDRALTRLNELQADHDSDINLAKLRISALHGLARSTEATAYFLSTHTRLRHDADEQELEHLRRHHDRLRDGHIPDTDVHPRRVPRQIPHDVTNFVGRKDLLAAMDETVTGTRSSGIVIVHGMAGVGKTALTVHWAHRHRGHFPDGEFYVDMHGFSGRQAIPYTTVIDDFLIALGRPPDKNQSPRERELLLNQLLADRRALVVLDNAASTTHIERLIPLLAGCLVVITSRQRLTKLSRVTGARQVSVNPMTLNEGTALLTARLPRQRVIGHEVGLRILTLCGGLPLVITVLAQHIANRESARLPEFVEQLTAQGLIDDIGLDGDETTNTMTFFAWSYESLDTSERRLFRLLGLHAGPDISVEAACACDGRTPAETRRSLGILIGAHLLEQPRAFDRFQLHDLLRQFARDRAESDEPASERNAADLRMIDYYLAAANEALRVLCPGALSAPALGRADDLPAISFRSPEDAKSWFDRERTTLMAVITHSADLDHHARTWRLADAVATMFDRYGYYEDGKVILALAVSSARAADDPDGEASCLATLGMMLVILGEHTEARRCLTAALQFAQAAGHVRGHGSALYQLGRLEMTCGNLSEAVALMRRCLQIMQPTGDSEGLAWAHCRLGEVLRLLDQHDEALVHLHQAQFHAQQISDASAHATALAEIGSVFQNRDEYHQAAMYCRQALAVVDSAPIPDLAISVHVCQALAAITSQLGEHEQAYGHARRAVDISRSTHNVSAEARSWEVLGGLYFSRGEVREAVIAWQQASELYDRVGNHRQSTILRASLRSAQAETDIPFPQSRPRSQLPAPVQSAGSARPDREHVDQAGDLQ